MTCCKPSHPRHTAPNYCTGLPVCTPRPVLTAQCQDVNTALLTLHTVWAHSYGYCTFCMSTRTHYFSGILYVRRHTMNLLSLSQWVPKLPDGRFAAYSVMYAYKWCLMISSRKRNKTLPFSRLNTPSVSRSWHSELCNAVFFYLLYFFYVIFRVVIACQCASVVSPHLFFVLAQILPTTNSNWIFESKNKSLVSRTSAFHFKHLKKTYCFCAFTTLFRINLGHFLKLNKKNKWNGFYQYQKDVFVMLGNSKQMLKFRNCTIKNRSVRNVWHQTGQVHVPCSFNNNL